MIEYISIGALMVCALAYRYGEPKDGDEWRAAFIAACLWPVAVMMFIATILGSEKD